MDRNSIIGLSLIFLIFIGYMYFQQPSEAEKTQQKRYQDSVALVQQKLSDSLKRQQVKDIARQDSLLKHADTATLLTKFGGFGLNMKGTEQKQVLENNKLKVTFSSRGGRISEVILKGFKRDDSTALVLFTGNESQYGYQLSTSAGPVNTGELFWQVQNVSASAITFRLPYDSARYLEQTYTIAAGDSYNVGSKLSAVGMNTVLTPSSNITVKWATDMPKQERLAETERQKSTVYFKYPEEKADFISETKSEEIKLEKKTTWVAFKQQFFNSTLIAKNGFNQNGKVSTDLSKYDNNKYVKRCAAELNLPYDFSASQTFDMQWFFGPNDFKTLKQENAGLESMVPLGWGFFGWINRWLVIPTFDFLSNYISSYGVIILLLTIIIKILLLPLVYRSYLSTAKMRILKPEMDAIKAKHGDDMQAAQMENLQLFKKAGVSPLGGCLPLLLQMPILIAIFQFFPSCFAFRQQPFLWADDLSRYDSIYNLGFNIPFYGDHVSLFTLLMTISTLIYTRMNNQLTGANAQMKWISYLMPVMFLGFFNKYPAALSYYYFLANCITFIQQWAIRKFVDEDKLHAQIAENKAKQGTATKSKFQQRLEEMAKQRQQPVRKK